MHVVKKAPLCCDFSVLTANEQEGMHSYLLDQLKQLPIAQAGGFHSFILPIYQFLEPCIP